ncbi:MAG: thiamine pyrophosphate-binding protein [Longimicrobiales bacterium]
MPHRAPDPALTASDAFVTSLPDMTVARLLLKYLELEGATKLFGIPGGALIFLIDELRDQRDRFDFYICRHETGAAYIAHGYARVSGELGVVLTTAGPAATNALTGTMNAQASNCSVLHISGEVPREYFGQGYLQEGIDAKLDVSAIYRNAVQSSAVVSSEKNFATLFRQALRDARSQPPRAAHISLPNDVAGTCVRGVTMPRSPANYRATPESTDQARVSATFAELAGAERPLIFLGNGARQALEDEHRLRRFTAMVEKFAIPVMTTPDAKGVFPESHAVSLRNYGMTACAWPDLYIGDPRDPDHYSKNLIPRNHFVQVDLDQSVIGRDFPITRGIVADAGATLDALCDAAAGHEPDPTRKSARIALLDEIKRTSPFADPVGRASDSAPLHPAALVREMNEVLERGHVVIDAGNCVGWSLNNLVVDPPLRYHSALDMGPMGFAVGAVIGGKIAAPDEPCVALVGDGAFMMHGAEISTAAQNGVGAVWVVLYDDDLSMVSQGMAELFPPPGPWHDYYKLGAPDLVKFSEGLGAQAVAVQRDQGPAAFRQALQTAVSRADASRRPQVVVAHIDTGPMPPYGWPHLKKPDCSAPT